MLVEDDPAIRRMAARFLRECGYTVLEAANGARALELLQGKPYSIDLLLTDVVMPEVSGRKLANTLLERFPRMKVLFVSGHTENTIVHQGVLDPGAAFLQKPFTQDDLAEKIRQVLHPVHIGGGVGADSPEGLGVQAKDSPFAGSTISRI
jgi:CheY-like chemotaxis protein